jgi:protein required for attachment to host cells
MQAVTTWVVLADAGLIRIVESTGPGKGLREITAFESAARRRTARDQGSERPGRTGDRMGPGRHALEPHSDPKDVATEGFERALLTHLEEATKKNAFDRLILVAAPKVLGDLRKMMDGRLAVEATLAKDLTQVPTHDLAPHLRAIVNF